jgi:hypothetical protein
MKIQDFKISALESKFLGSSFNYVRDVEGGYLLFQSDTTQYLIRIQKDGSFANWIVGETNNMGAYHSFDYSVDDRFFTFNGNTLEECFYTSKNLLVVEETEDGEINKDNSIFKTFGNVGNQVFYYTGKHKKTQIKIPKRSKHSSYLYGETLLIYGGVGENNKVLDDLYSISITKNYFAKQILINGPCIYSCLGNFEKLNSNQLILFDNKNYLTLLDLSNIKFLI